MAVDQDTLAEELENTPPVEDDENWDPSTLDRGDNLEEVPRETPDPVAEEVSEEEVAVDLGKAPEEEKEESEEPQEEEPLAATAKEEKKPHAVPQIRLSKEIERRKAIEAENLRLRQELEQQAPQANQAADEIQERMRQLVAEEHEAILAGNTDKANDFRMQHSDLQMQLVQQSMAEVQQVATQATKNELVFESAVDELQGKYPVFDPNSEAFDHDLLNDVLRDRDAFYNAGTPLADALRRAVNISVALNGLESAGEKKEAVSSASVTKAEDETAKQQATKKKVEAAQQQPPTLRGESSTAHGEQALRVEDMSEEDFDALPEATLKRLRGDI